MLFILPQKLFAFLLYCKLRTIETYWNYAADHLLLLHIRLFSKTKSSLELVSLPHFVHDFWRKKLFLSYSNTWLRFTVSLPLLREVLSNTCIAIVCVFYCNCIMCIAITAWKVSKYGVISDPYFPHSDWIRARNNSVFGHFSRSELYWN